MLYNCPIHGLSPRGDGQCPQCMDAENEDYDIIDCITRHVSCGKSNGGPSSYYDFEPGAVTWNDVAEVKAQTQWGAYSYHMKDISNAVMRFGAKDGTTSAYDARKIIYSGLRLLGMIEGKQAMRQELLSLLNDKQFK